MDQVKQILDDVIAEYSKLQLCRAIALIGSQARGTAKPWSNIDIMVVDFALPRIEDRQTILDRLNDSGKKAECEQYPIVCDRFHRGGYPVKVWHVSQDVICERVATIDKRLRLSSPMLISSLHESRILYDPKKQLQAWKSRISPIPIEYKHVIIPQLFGEIVSVIEDLGPRQESHNLFYLQHDILESIKNIYELVFLLNDQYLNLSPRIEQIVSEFKMLPQDFKTKIKNILVTSGDIPGLRQKWRMLAELTYELGKFIQKEGHYNLKDPIQDLLTAASFLKK